MEYEIIWDFLGLILAGAAIYSAFSTFTGNPIYVKEMTMGHLFAHLVVTVLGFALTEGGVLKFYTRTLAAFSSILG